MEREKSVAIPKKSESRQFQLRRRQNSGQDKKRLGKKALNKVARL